MKGQYRKPRRMETVDVLGAGGILTVFIAVFVLIAVWAVNAVMGLMP